MKDNTVFDGSGEMCSIMRAYDWKSSRLDQWMIGHKVSKRRCRFCSVPDSPCGWHGGLNSYVSITTPIERPPWAKSTRGPWDALLVRFGAKYGMRSAREFNRYSIQEGRPGMEGLLLFLERSGFYEETASHLFLQSSERRQRKVGRHVVCRNGRD